MSWSNLPVPPNQSTVTTEITAAIDAQFSGLQTGAAITIGDGTNDFTGGSATSLFQQVGNLVFSAMTISWVGKGSASGVIEIGPLPVTASGAGWDFAGVVNSSVGIAFLLSQLTITRIGTDAVGFNILVPDGSATTALTDSDFSVAGSITLSFVYTAPTIPG